MRREICSTTIMCRFSTHKNEPHTELAPRFFRWMEGFPPPMIVLYYMMAGKAFEEQKPLVLRVEQLEKKLEGETGHGLGVTGQRSNQLNVPKGGINAI